VKLAESYGHVSLRVQRPQDVEPALHEAMRLRDRTVFLDIRTDPAESVWPTVVSGKGLTECCWVPKTCRARATA
jgi:acetolactate synthase-1/2/3 large subunit